MNRTRCLIALILLLLFDRMAFAEANLTVELSGVSGEQRDNVLLMLSIEQQKSHPDINIGRIRRLHAKAPETPLNSTVRSTRALRCPSAR